MADIVVTAANVLKGTGAATTTGTAGEAITAGQSLYLSSTDSKVYKADCSTAAKAACVGIALNSAPGAGQPVSYLTGGDINPGGTAVVGTVYGVTDTAGGIGAISERGAADYVTIIGIATTASNISVQIKAGGVAIPT